MNGTTCLTDEAGYICWESPSEVVDAERNDVRRTFNQACLYKIMHNVMKFIGLCQIVQMVLINIFFDFMRVRGREISHYTVKVKTNWLF